MDSATHSPLSPEHRAVVEQEFLPHLDALYSFGYYLSRDENTARDLLQDVFVRAMDYVHTYERGTNAKAWLFRIMNTSFINLWRKQSRQPRQVDIEDLANAPDQDTVVAVGYGDLQDELLREGMSDEVLAALGQLSPDAQTILLLCDLEELKYEEAAEVLNIPVGTVRSRLHRAREKLKAHLREYAAERGY